MNGADYCFFFSYSRADWDDDPYLRKFYEDLDRRVARAKGWGERLAGFRDQVDIKTGADWNTAISGAVQASDVLVCIFTPNFFSPAKPFCAREFMAFLKRNPPIRYARKRENGGYRYEMRDARNIVPILWVGKKELETLSDLPPSIVRKISHSLAEDSIPSKRISAYREIGLSRFAAQPRTVAYQEILEHLALRIVELSKTPPGRIAPPPDIETLADAFRELPEKDIHVEDSMPEPVQAIPGPVGRGPNTVLALEVSVPGPDWIPYAGSWKLEALAGEVAESRRPRFAYKHQKFDADAVDMPARLRVAMDAATTDQVVPILFIQPACLANAGIRSALTSLAAGDWRGGLLIPIEGPQGDPAGDVKAFRVEIEEARRKENRESMPVRIPAIAAEFHIATDAIVTDVVSRIVSLGKVQQTPPQNDGPPAVPRVTNMHDAPRQQ
jgi:TIR domain